MFIRGNVYRHPKLRFHDGETGDKLLILLNNPSDKENGIFVKTTSRQHSKPSIAGCIKDHSCFYIPSDSDFFNTNTWIQLYDIYPFDAKEAEKKDGLHKMGELNKGIVDKIIDCLLLVMDEDLPPILTSQLKPSLESSVSNLAEKFKRL